jgi:N-acetylglucosaminyldiphosphoundecaprenol N-acetyl-beta-D-mannosaminyltransferase
MKSEREILTLRFRGVKIHNVDYQDVYDFIATAANKGSTHYVCMTDVGNVIAATRNEGLKSAINGAVLSLADGTPLVWFARLAGCKRMERISGVDLMERLFYERNGMRHFLLGDTEATIRRVIARARKIDRYIQICGFSPPFKEFDDEDNRVMIEKIRAVAPDIIWVSFGAGKQERWMQQNIKYLERGVMIGVGAAFKWFTGSLKVPPRFLQTLGLQCLFRVVQELASNPGKGWKFLIDRQVKVFPAFLAQVPFELRKQRRTAGTALKRGNHGWRRHPGR